MTRLIIVGGGLAGSLSAVALAKRRPDVDLLLIEQGDAFGGNHIWSFFDTDVSDEDRWVLQDCELSHWAKHDIRFPGRRRTLGLGYNSLRSSRLDEHVRAVLRPEQWRLGRKVQLISPTSITLADGEQIEGDAVIDARGPKSFPGLELGWQKFVGRVYRFQAPHGVERPVIMDATVKQLGGYRFVYRLPLSPTDLLIEDTYYSISPELDRQALDGRLDEIASGVGPEREIQSEEHGVLPLVLGGNVGSLWRGEPIPQLGLRGGFFHPTTGYSLPDAVRNAVLLAQQADFIPAGLYDLYRSRSTELWQERSFFQLLNRMLFQAAEPGQAYRVLEHFYRLPDPIVARFYAAEIGTLDKLRILSGRPPVPIGRALSALRSKAA